jgi:hypothetical protein
MPKTWQMEITDCREKADALAQRLRADGWIADVVPYGNRRFEGYAERTPTEQEIHNDLIADAALAAELFGEDELEAYAANFKNT